MRLACAALHLVGGVLGYFATQMSGFDEKTCRTVAIASWCNDLIWVTTIQPATEVWHFWGSGFWFGQLVQVAYGGAYVQHLKFANLGCFTPPSSDQLPSRTDPAFNAIQCFHNKRVCAHTDTRGHPSASVCCNDRHPLLMAA